MRACVAALVLLTGCALAQPVSAQPADALAGYAFRRIEVTSGARIPPSLADRVRDAVARRLPPAAGQPATVGIKILDVRQAADGQLHLWAVVAVTDTASGSILTEFDAQATTPVTQRESESLQAEALAESIASLLTRQ
jgi:hypothetical protein